MALKEADIAARANCEIADQSTLRIIFSSATGDLPPPAAALSVVTPQAATLPVAAPPAASPEDPMLERRAPISYTLALFL